MSGHKMSQALGSTTVVGSFAFFTEDSKGSSAARVTCGTWYSVPLRRNLATIAART